MSTVVIGLGNPVLTDDGVGIHVAHAIRSALPPGTGVEIREAYAGGLRLVDQILGFDRAVVIDALWTGQHTPGTVVRLRPGDLRGTRNTLSLHDLDLATALDLARETGCAVPVLVDLWGVEIKDASTYGEDLTPEVRSAVPGLTAAILDDLASAERRPVHTEGS